MNRERDQLLAEFTPRELDILHLLAEGLDTTAMSQRLGIAPLRFLANQVIRLQGKPTTPGAFYRGMRTMALDGFVVDVADTPANDRAFGRPGSSR